MSTHETYQQCIKQIEQCVEALQLFERIAGDLCWAMDFAKNDVIADVCSDIENAVSDAEYKVEEEREHLEHIKEEMEAKIAEFDKELAEYI